MIESSSLLGWEKGWVLNVYYSVYFNAATTSKESQGIIINV